MNKQLITQELIDSHINFINFISNLSEKEYNYSLENKWDSGEHLDHIIKSVSILNKIFIIPKWLIKWRFGKANRPSRSKEILITKYLDKLQTAKSTHKRFQPNKIEFKQREKKVKALKKEVEKLCKRANKFSEEDIDYYILPHPLLGNLTFRELLYFTSYHVKHHQELIKNSLQNK